MAHNPGEALQRVSRIYHELSRNTSGSRAYRFLKLITLRHRIQGSPGLYDAIEDIAALLEESLPDATVRIHRYNESMAPKWLRLPVGWTVEDASLHASGHRYAFKHHPTLPAAHTPGSDGVLEGNVVENKDPLNPQSYESARDKVHLITKHHRLAYRLAAEAGVPAVILAHPDRHHEAFPYLGLFLTPEEAKMYSTVAVTLPWRIAKLLAGKQVYIRVNSTFTRPELPVLEAVLWGSPGPDAPTLEAHICHPMPGANDNASGSAAALEAFFAIYETVSQGWLPVPDMPIRLILMPEYTGTLLHYHNTSPPRHSLNLDMVGRAQPHAEAPRLVYTPPSVGPSLAGDVFYDVILASAGRLRGPDRYMWGSDHDVGLYMGQDSVMVNQWPDPYYHTDMDDADTISPSILEYVASHTATTIYLLASGYQPTGMARRLVASYISSNHNQPGEAYRVLAWAYGIEDGLPLPSNGGGIRALKPVFAWMLAGPVELEEKVELARRLEEIELPDESRMEILYAANRGVTVEGLKRLFWASYPGSRVEDQLQRLLQLLDEHGFIETM